MKQIYTHTPPERISRIMSLKAKDNLKRGFIARFSDNLTQQFGTSRSLFIHVFVFGLWMAINVGMLPILPVLDPFPFTFMTTIMSIEAIILAIFVLISQNRQTLIQDVREEVDLQVNVHAEAEITKILKMLDEIQNHLGISKKNDPELLIMEHKINSEKMTKDVEREITDFT